MDGPADSTLPDDVVLTVEEVAAFLKLDVQTVRALARTGELPAVKLGKQWRFRRDRLLAALEPATAVSSVSANQDRDGPISHAEAAQLLGVTVRTVARMISDGRLETVASPTGIRRLSRASVLAYGGASAAANGGTGGKWSTTQ